MSTAKTEKGQRNNGDGKTEFKKNPGQKPVGKYGVAFKKDENARPTV